MKYDPPFIVIAMPLNKDGNGPEMDEEKVVKTIYEVWDACFRTVSTHETDSAARKAQERATKEFTDSSFRSLSMAQSSKSQIINKLKTRSRGGWETARKVEPKARGAGGLPPNLKNAVAVLKSYKLSETTKGDPFFSLSGIVKEPQDLEGRRVTFQWFMNASEYNTYEEAEAQLANDIGLLTPDQEVPEEYEAILEVFKELCERGVHILFNTGKERTKGRMPNNYIQGLADGWDDEPQEGAGEDTATRQDRGQGNGQRQEQTRDDHPVDDNPSEDDVQGTESEPEPEPEPEADDAVYIPKKGDKYFYTYKKVKSEYKVTASYPDKEKVDLQELKPAKGAKALVFKGVGFSKLEVE